MGKVMDINKRLEQDLQFLCEDVRDRALGSMGNQKAAAHIERRLSVAGWQTQTSSFKCMDYETIGTTVQIDHIRVEAFASPYTMAYSGTCLMESAQNMEQLQRLHLADRILVMHGALCKEPIMPKNFTFYNPVHHQALVEVLEQKKPNAIICITGTHPQTAGAVNPFPLFEDGDFDIPTIYMTKAQGERVLEKCNQPVRLHIDARRIASKGNNVIAVKPGRQSKRMVFCAHLDAKKGVQGALDNASGVAVCLALADRLSDQRFEHTIEIAFLNGEDHYSNAGEMQYLAQNQEHFGDITCAVNIDGVGLVNDCTAYGIWMGEPLPETLVHQAFKKPEFLQYPLWEQGDHMLFAQNGVPCVALCSSDMERLTETIIHTKNDTPDRVDCSVLEDVTKGLYRFASLLVQQ